MMPGGSGLFAPPPGGIIGGRGPIWAMTMLPPMGAVSPNTGTANDTV